MLSDYELFTQLCLKRGVFSPSEILDAMKIASSTGELRLPCQSIVIPVCEIISRVLISSSTIKSVDLSDCMLITKGLSKLLESLRDGTNITTLNLKGNNISGLIASQLGEIFQHNNTLKRLYLQWNNIGSEVEAFDKFCQGLAMNYNIEELDLRYNQITPHCADALMNLLKKNKALKVLNLEWNTLGLHGGQSLLNGIKDNNSITKLNLRGNCVPDSIVDLIDNVTLRNQSKKSITSSNITSKSTDKLTGNCFSKNDNCIMVLYERAHKLSLQDTENKLNDSESADEFKLKELGSNFRKKRLRRKKNSKSDKLLNSNSDSDSDSSFKINYNSDKGSKTEFNKIMELNKILHDRSETINVLTKQINTKDEEIKSSNELVEKLRYEIDEWKRKFDEIVEEKKREVQELEEKHKKIEEDLKKNCKTIEDKYNICLLKNKDWEEKVRYYEKNIHKSSLEVIALREKWMSKSKDYEDIIEIKNTEVHKIRREFKERDNKYKIEVNILKSTLKETTTALEDCQDQLQKSRNELREMASSLATFRAKVDELEGIDCKYGKVVEVCQRIKDEKFGVEEKLNDAQRIIAGLKKRVQSLESELVDPQRKYDLLKGQLDEERDKSARLKQELEDERMRIRDQDCQLQKMSQQVTVMSGQINDIQKNYAEELRERDKDIKQLKEIIAGKEKEFNDLKAEEAQRAGHLHAAFNKYLSSIGP
ncbi:GSCOCG00000016001-RA-CDS [Cotesia congregata]|uniref:Similar to Lrrc45: Leucine-rich repeat-containing protein 45 (Mus musculus) n=1 Tax=Cotesia congregata TaxID=51543 RepID=A0A8J2MNR1_COTCN|nr:GSCOCG00000016001-RA-CDS [Cotesia congregata]CAG5100941.1 Similar to Lrrc45: Leucine-rich repeat-containing protein 45 (Mus musculus) [Cotesia congregata]